MIKTTGATLDAFKINIPLVILSKTFQNAVDICRRLKIYFLWIDAVCIIQDNPEDWKEEAGKMADIFENAFLTIAADSAKQGSEGCYRTTNAIHLAQPVVDGTFVRAVPPEFSNCYRIFDQHPLSNRGWVYQEMRLSRRILHYRSDEVVWECRCSINGESGKSEDLTKLAEYHGDEETILPVYNFTSYWKLARAPRLSWYRTVQKYSRLQLSYESGRMIAISALAQRMERLRGDGRYLAGLWEKTLLFDLL
ncbi:hypothetical protein G7Y89_g2333 [Cudoniella acicularis]|uniref:Heterokaryon incompatibility domain-containing protein n=1 Tax=Cudoniella acicularis TaxID=354080 RepID=A0A8H4RUM5_9HELO|nr:hypothetical protein G7Y89_g2333 [Cudoniella acicularis]